jgi:hypothetical protein
MAASPHRSRSPPQHPPGKIVHRASEPSPPTVGAPFSRTAFPVRHFGRTTDLEPIVGLQSRSGQIAYLTTDD